MTGSQSNDTNRSESLAPTIVITLLFGVFGVIPAALASSRAQRGGGRGSRYWVAFGCSFLMAVLAEALLVILVAVPFIIAQGSPVRYERLPATLAGYPLLPNLPNPSAGPIERSNLILYGRFGEGLKVEVGDVALPSTDALHPVNAGLSCTSSIRPVPDLVGKLCYGKIAGKQIEIQFGDIPGDWQATGVVAFQELRAAFGS